MKSVFRSRRSVPGLLALFVWGCQGGGAAPPAFGAEALSLGLSTAGASPAVGPTPTDEVGRERDSEPPGSEPPGYVTWCASGGAPIVGAPVVDDQERAYIATADGYLHAFERDGRFRWSYTVKGTPLGSVSLRPTDGAILMGTTGRYIYAINQDGSLRFRYPTLTPVWSGLFALNESTVVFLGHDKRLYALASNGARRYRVKAPSDPMGGPVVASGNVVWLPLVDGVARFKAAFLLKRYPLPVVVEQVAILGQGVVARGGGQAFFVNADGEVEALGAVSHVASDGERALLVEGTSARLLDRHLKPMSAKLPERWELLSAAPVLLDQAIWIPQSDGLVRVHSLDSGQSLQIAVREGALSTPVVGPTGRWALIPSPGGRFCAVQLNDRTDL